VATRTHWTKWAAPTRAKLWVNHNKMLATTPGTYGVKAGWTVTKMVGGMHVAATRNYSNARRTVFVNEQLPCMWR